MKTKSPPPATRFVHLETTWRHLRRTPYQALVTLIVLTINFFIISIFVLVAAGSEQTLRNLEGQPQVIGFFKTAPTQPQLTQLNSQLQDLGDIEKINYISQDQALEIYKQLNIDNPLLLEMVTANILPASIEVSTNHPESLAQVADVLNLHENIEEVIYQRDVVDQLVKWTKFLRIAGLILIGLLTLASFLTIFIIIGMKIAMRREEAEVLRLIGANSSYIRWPFVLEGLTYGLVGAFCGWGLTYITLLYTTPYIIDLIWSLHLLPVPWTWMASILAIEMFAGGLWSSLAAIWAVNRYLKERK